MKILIEFHNNSNVSEKCKVLIDESINPDSEPLEDFIAFLMEKMVEGWEYINLSWGYDSAELSLQKYRDETDQEYAIRLNKNKKVKAEE
jgi:hypothetical protein